MILSFDKRFEKSIIDGVKIHTIREDKPNRWKEGNIIHFATGVRTKNYNQFHSGICVSTQEIEIKVFSKVCVVFVDNEMLREQDIMKLYKQDGFNCFSDFYDWFGDYFKGKIIHWTDFKY